MTSAARPLRILATAYACDPRTGSEPGIGWNWVRQIASRHDCWLITRENNVEFIERAARDEGLDRLRVRGFDLPYWMRFWKRGARGAMPYFYLWQLGLVRLARAMDREVDFDVVHHLTFSSSWIPSGLSFVSKPFVWGPVGQHPRVPDRFLLRSDWKLRLSEWGKACLRNTLPVVDPFLRHTVRSADRILSLGREGRSAIPRSRADRIVPMLACGTDPCLPSACLAPVCAPPPTSAAHVGRGPRFRVLYAGRLVDLKGVRLVVDAFASFAQRTTEGGGAEPELHIAGDGPRRGWLERRAKELGVESSVRFHGHQSLERTLELMTSADVFLFPSFEGAGMVVVEAMERECPVVCLDFGGPGEMVDETRGLRVSAAGTFDESAAALARALTRLYDDEPLRARLAHAAQGWVAANAYWDRKGERLADIYGEVASSAVPDERRSRAA